MPHQLSIDIVGTLRDKANRRFPLQSAILELIDNSIDAGATEVGISEVDGDLIVSDNGEGFKSIVNALDIGASSKRSRGAIGRYGVGLKDAALRYSNETVIRSRGKMASVDWQGILSCQLDPVIPDPEPCEDSGITEIIFRDFRKKYTAEIQTDGLRRAYDPKLRDGAISIVVNGTRLTPIPLPKFTESIEKEFEIGGKSAKIVGGIYKSNDAQGDHWCGYNIFYRGRLIGPGNITNIGVGSESCSFFCFIVHIFDSDSEGWHLATNKDDSDDFGKLLDHCYFNYTRNLLVKGAEQSKVVELSEVEKAINEVAKICCGSGNQTRQKTGEKPGTVKGTGRGSPKVRTNTSAGPGKYEDTSAVSSEHGPSHKRKNFEFKFAELPGMTLGRVAIGPGNRPIITFNTTNPWVSANNSIRAVDSIIPIAVSVYYYINAISGSDTAPDQLVNASLEKIGAHMASVVKVQPVQRAKKKAQ